MKEQLLLTFNLRTRPIQAGVEMSDCKSVTSQLTTRWSGPGMPRLKQEEIEIRVSGKAYDGVIPGRSARSRYAATGFLVTTYPVCKLIKCAESCKSTGVILL